MNRNNLSILDKTHGDFENSELPFALIKEDILGSSYELSLVFVDKEEAVNLNKTYRHKEYIPNVLSFPLDENEGEIFICPSIAKEEAPKYEKTEEKYLLYLFIHGCFHLKGFTHGSAMEREEKKIREKYSV